MRAGPRGGGAEPRRGRPVAGSLALAALLVILLSSCGREWRTPVGRLRKLSEHPLYELSYAAEGRATRVADAARTAFASSASVAAPSARGFAESFACTVFSARDEAGRPLMGRNFDWERDPVLVLLLEPEEGYASVSLVDLRYLGYGPDAPPEAAPAALAEAPSLPFDGMNERGLAVGMMAVTRADGRVAEGLPTVSELGLIRVLLDRAADVEEALGLLRGYNVDFDGPPLHYFLADATGASALVEYPGGEPRVYRGEEIGRVATNFIFHETPRGEWSRSCARWSLAEARLSGAGGALGADGAFGLLEDVAQASTQWSAVYRSVEPRLELALGRDFGRRFAWSLGGGGSFEGAR